MSINKIFGVIKILGSVFAFAAAGAFIFISVSSLRSYEFLSMITIAVFTLICCAYLLYSALMDLKGACMKKNIVVWVGFGVCTFSLLLVGYYWGWAEKITFGVPFLFLLVRDFLLLRKEETV